jgi:DNA-binding SARP family transcriptional activator/tetratricopeptide (TPR) repeat protein
VLAALLIDAGRLVTWQTLIDRVWGEVPPNGVRASLYSHIARIRQLLRQAADGDEPAALLERRPGGYLLDVDPDLVDLHLFRRLVRAAREPGGLDARRVVLLREALSLWRGEPLAGLTGPWATRLRESLEQQRLDAVVAWAEAEVRVNNPLAVVEPLTALLDQYPLLEPLAAALMRALHAAGRTAQALDCFTRTRQRLVGELGADPGPELQHAHLAVLRGDSVGASAPPTAEVPAQLPVGVPGFAGRAEELDQLNALTLATETRAVVPIVALLGTAGVGKTALALHWGHRIAADFPDGQLYVNLRGFDADANAMDPAEAVRGFLDSFGVPPQRVPATLATQAGLYRSIVANRRVLVVLDNARDAEQVRPLLPGAPGCLALVTSRNQLLSLVSAEGAQPITLELLAPPEARQLLAGRLGSERLVAEPAAVDDIIEYCARLPLALAIVAARAATHRTFSLGAFAGELRRGRLDGLSGPDVRAVFSWSYDALGPDAARLFRLLGMHPGPDLAVPAAASLAALPVPRTRVLLDELADAHLVSEHAPGRFAFHDLLRAYAAELAQELDGKSDQRAALRRTYDHYLHVAHTADRLLHPSRDAICLAPARLGVALVPLADEQQALAWFTAERPVLLAAIRHSSDTGFDVHAWQLAWTISTFLDRRGHWHDWAASQQTALCAAQRAGDRVGRAQSHRGLAGAAIWLNRYDDADVHLKHALDVLDRLNDQAGQAHVHLDLAWMSERQGRIKDVLHHAQQALRLYRSAGHQAGEARTLNTVGWAYALLDQPARTIEYCEQALRLVQEIGDRSGEAYTWDSLGYAHQQLGHHRHAIGCYQRALDLFRGLGDRYYEADTLNNLGDSHHAGGAPEAARQAWQQAYQILVELAHATADDVRAKIVG